MHFKKTQKKHDHIKIKWAKNNICRIDFNEFTLSVPMENLKDIRKWEDIEAFSKNRAVSAYNYEKNYTAKRLLVSLEKCFANGIAGGQVNYYSVQEFHLETGIAWKTGQNKSCNFQFINQISVNNLKTNYSIICNIPESEGGGEANIKKIFKSDKKISFGRG